MQWFKQSKNLHKFNRRTGIKAELFFKAISKIQMKTAGFCQLEIHALPGIQAVKLLPPPPFYLFLKDLCPPLPLNPLIYSLTSA